MNGTAPATAMTTRERYLGGYPARTPEEQAKYAEYGLIQAPACPRHGLAVTGGPVVYHCDGGPGRGHGIYAADLVREVRS